MALQTPAEEKLLSPNESKEQVNVAPHTIRKQSAIKQVELDSTITQITCGIAWDFFGKKIDLDVTVVALDTYSFEMDAAYYNQTSILDGAIIHSGDDKTGLGDGDDEQIKINLSKLPQRCRSLWFMVNAFSGGSFTDVETARFTLYDGTDHSKILYSYGIGMAFNSTALLLGVLSVNDPYSNDKQWSFKMIEEKGSGHNFVESKHILINKLNILYDEGILMERPKDRNEKYELVKGDMYVIDPEIVNISVGLGWDPDSQGIDVDASIIIFNVLDDGKSFIKTDIVYYGNKDYVGAVTHGGDNLTGAGSGDDEVIAVNLDKLDDNKEADILCVVINIYSGESSFKSIRNCFARLVDDRNKELCRFNLSEEYGTQAMIMCHVEKRKNGCWAMITDGIGCRGNTAKESVNDAVQVIKGEGFEKVDTSVYDNRETERLVNSGNNNPPAPDSDECCVIL